MHTRIAYFVLGKPNSAKYEILLSVFATFYLLFEPFNRSLEASVPFSENIIHTTAKYTVKRFACKRLKIRAWFPRVSALLDSFSQIYHSQEASSKPWTVDYSPQIFTSSSLTPSSGGFTNTSLWSLWSLGTVRRLYPHQGFQCPVCKS